MDHRAKSQAVPKTIGSVARGLAVNLPYVRRQTNGVSVTEGTKEENAVFASSNFAHTSWVAADAIFDQYLKWRTQPWLITSCLYGPYYAPAAPVAALSGAAVCLAFSLIGAC